MIAGSIFWFVVFAVSGAFIVLAGLLMEQYCEQRLPRNINDFRLCKSIKLCGEWLVIGGVLVEFAVGILSAIHEWKNDPLNRPIVTTSAYVWFEVHGTNAPLINVDKWPSGELQDTCIIEFGRQEEAKTNKWRLILRCISQSHFGNSNDMFWSLEFAPDPMNPSGNLISSDTVNSANKWDMVYFFAFMFVPPNDEITKGSVVLFINSEKMEYPIKPQRPVADFSPFPYLMGSKISVQALGVFP
jgi:hypothetical protein